jgi:hypothetical protein
MEVKGEKRETDRENRRRGTKEADRTNIFYI